MFVLTSPLRNPFTNELQQLTFFQITCFDVDRLLSYMDDFMKMSIDTVPRYDTFLATTDAAPDLSKLLQNIL